MERDRRRGLVFWTPAPLSPPSSDTSVEEEADRGLEQALDRIVLGEDETGLGAHCGDAGVNTNGDNFHTLPTEGDYDDHLDLDHGPHLVFGSDLDFSDEDGSSPEEHSHTPTRCLNNLTREELHIPEEQFPSHYISRPASRDHSPPLLTRPEAITDEILPAIPFWDSSTDSQDSPRSSPRPEKLMDSSSHHPSAETRALNEHCGLSKIPVKVMKKISAGDTHTSASKAGSGPLKSSCQTRPSPFREKRARRTQAAVFRIPNVLMPDLSKVEPRVRFPKDGYTPPKGRCALRSASLSPEPPLVYKSPADIVKEVLFAPDSEEEEDSLVLDALSIVPPEFRSRQQATVLMDELQEDNYRLKIKCAEKANTIDRLRLEGKVNLFSDPPKPGLPLYSGLRTQASQPLTVEIPRTHRAQLSSSLQTGSASSTSGGSCSDAFGILHHGAQTFLDKMESFESSMNNGTVLPEKISEVAHVLSQLLDNLEQGYLLAKREHTQQQSQDTGSFDPHRELESLIFQCGQRMEEMKEKVQLVLQTTSTHRNTPPSTGYQAGEKSLHGSCPVSTSAGNCPSVAARLQSQAQRILHSVEAYEALLANGKLQTEQQRKVLFELIQKMNALQKEYILAKEEHRRQETDSFDPTGEVESLVLQCGQQLDELNDRVQSDQPASLSTTAQAPPVPQAPPTSLTTRNPASPILQAPPTSLTTPTHAPPVPQAPPSSLTTPTQAPPILQAPPTQAPLVLQAPPTSLATPPQAPPVFQAPPTSLTTPTHAPPVFQAPPTSLTTPTQAPLFLQAPPTSLTTPPQAPPVFQAPPTSLTTPTQAPLFLQAPPTSLTTPTHAPFVLQAPPTRLPIRKHASPILQAPPTSLTTPTQAPLVLQAPPTNLTTPTQAPLFLQAPPTQAPLVLQAPPTSLATATQAPLFLQAPPTSLATATHAPPILQDPPTSLTTSTHAPFFLQAPPTHAPLFLQAPPTSLTTRNHAPPSLQAPPTSLATPTHALPVFQAPPTSLITPTHAPLFLQAPPTTPRAQAQHIPNATPSLPLQTPPSSADSTVEIQCLSTPSSSTVRSSSSEDDQSHALRSTSPEPLSKHDQPDSVIQYQSLKVLPKPLVRDLSEGPCRGPVPATDPECEYDEGRRLSNALAQRPHQYGREAGPSAPPSRPAVRSRLPNSLPIHPPSYSTSRAGHPSTVGGLVLAQTVVHGPCRGGSEAGQSPSSSLSSLRGMTDNKAPSERRRGLSQDGVISPETDSGFLGSEGSRLTPAAAASPVHQREPPGGSGVPPVDGPSARAQQQSRRSRRGERRHAQSHRVYTESLSGHNRLHSGVTSEEDQSKQSSGSAFSFRHHGDLQKAPHSGRRPGHNEALELLQAEVLKLKNNMDTFVRSRDRAERRQPSTSTPVSRSDRHKAGCTGRLERPESEEDAMSQQRKSVSSKTSQTEHQFPAQVSRPTQTSADHCARTIRPLRDSKEKTDAKDRALKSPVCPECRSRGKSTEGSFTGNPSKHDCAHCRLCGTTESDWFSPRGAQTLTSDRPVHCVPVCPHPVLLYPCPPPVHLCPTQSEGPSRLRGPTERSVPGDGHASLDTSLNRALRAAWSMKSTSRHMVHTLASGRGYRHTLHLTR